MQLFKKEMWPKLLNQILKVFTTGSWNSTSRNLAPKMLPPKSKVLCWRLCLVALVPNNSNLGKPQSINRMSKLWPIQCSVLTLKRMKQICKCWSEKRSLLLSQRQRSRNNRGVPFCLFQIYFHTHLPWAWGELEPHQHTVSKGHLWRIGLEKKEGTAYFFPVFTFFEKVLLS